MSKQCTLTEQGCANVSAWVARTAADGAQNEQPTISVLSYSFLESDSVDYTAVCEMEADKTRSGRKERLTLQPGDYLLADLQT